jgi:hypothetical protein
VPSLRKQSCVTTLHDLRASTGYDQAVPLLDELATTVATDRAMFLAENMPLVHFPSSTRLQDWSLWPAFSSPRSRGQGEETLDRFEDLRLAHFFVYAGPCCFAQPDHIGDAALYFRAGCEQTNEGAACPFDSGSLQDPKPRLQPWASRDVDSRWQFLQEMSVPLGRWRNAFGQWLTACYADPLKYLDTSLDRYGDGLPDSTIPPELRANNGTSGQLLHGRCSDRRAWTWELRLALPLARREASVLLFAAHLYEEANKYRLALRAEESVVLHLRAVREGASPDEFYVESGPLVKRRLFG